MASLHHESRSSVRTGRVEKRSTPRAQNSGLVKELSHHWPKVLYKATQKELLNALGQWLQPVTLLSLTSFLPWRLGSSSLDHGSQCHCWVGGTRGLSMEWQLARSWGPTFGSGTGFNLDFAPHVLTWWDIGLNIGNILLGKKRAGRYLVLQRGWKNTSHKPLPIARSDSSQPPSCLQGGPQT